MNTWQLKLIDNSIPSLPQVIEVEADYFTVVDGRYQFFEEVIAVNESNEQVAEFDKERVLAIIRKDVTKP